MRAWPPATPVPPSPDTGRGGAGRRVGPALVLLLAGLGWGLPAAVTAGPAAEPWLGANLPAVSDWAYTPVYADLVHQARPFGPPERPWGGERVPVGPDGWPTGDFGVLLMAQQGQGAGTYTVRFTGTATVSLVGSPDTRLDAPRHDPRTGRHTLQVHRGPAAENLALAFTGTRGGVRDLQVLRPGDDQPQPPLFTRAFKDHLARFSTLRVMDWLHTNGSTVSRWADRATPATRHASAAGVPWEHIVALANQTGKDLWVNIPALADDDYVRQLARLLRTTLRPGLRVYVEYSNEVWNGSFAQAGQNARLAREAPAPGRDGQVRADVRALQRIALRGAQVSALFREVWGDAAMMRTVRPVFATQAVQPAIARLGLAAVADTLGPPARYFWGLAIAPYFNLGPQQTAEGLDVEQVLAAMGRSVDAIAVVNQFEAHQALARWYGLQLAAYEGGSDTWGPGSLAAKRAASLDPRFEALCGRYLRQWRASGGGLFLWYSAGAGNWSTRHGSWELSTDPSLPDTAKTRCLDQALAAPAPPPAARWTAPGSIPALAYAGNPGPPFSESSRLRVRHLRPGAEPLDYLLHVATGGRYELVLTVAAALPGHTLRVGLDGQDAGTVGVSARGWSQPLAQSPLALTLAPGWHTLRLQAGPEPAAPSRGVDLQALALRVAAP